jgi:hypothetical protein
MRLTQIPMCNRLRPALFAAQTADHGPRLCWYAALAPGIVLAPTAMEIIGAGACSGQHKITKARTGDRAGSAMATVATAIGMVTTHATAHSYGRGCGQGDAN